MSVSEFQIIARYFDRPGLRAEPGQAGCQLGIGDDCAILRPAPGQDLLLSMDLLSEGVHFPSHAPPHLLAQRALAVNLSDLAAMGAEPLGFTLGLSLPRADETWLAAFSEGLLSASHRYDCPLLGGDMVKGALQIAIQVHGQAPMGKALRRDGARPGDLVFVTGPLGDAGLALQWIQGELASHLLSEQQQAALEKAFYLPEPRLQSGIKLREWATAALDISDGLLADLGHLAGRSGVAMEIQAQRLPLSGLMQALCTPDQALTHALAAGDDYELAFTVRPQPGEDLDTLTARLRAAGVDCHGLGRVLAGEGVRCLDASGQPIMLAHGGYRHFQEDKA